MEVKSNKALVIVAALVVLLAVIAAVFFMNGSDDSQQEKTTDNTTAESQQEAAPARQTIVDAAVASDNFTTLVAAVKAADLVATLSGTDTYTVFAPTDAAFDKLPAGTIDSLLKPESKETLSGILTYHVVSGAVLSSQLSNGQKVITVNGAELTVVIENGMVYLVDAKGGKSMVTQADIKVDNGVIHAIDSVLMPQ